MRVLLIGWSAVFWALMGLIASLPAHAQSPTSTDGTDFYIGYFCDRDHPVPIAALVGAYQQDTITISQFDQKGNESVVDRFILGPLSTTQRTIKTNLLTVPDCVPTYASCHIIATSPISLQVYSDKNNGCELYLALPTDLLSTDYRTTNYANLRPMTKDSLLRPVIEVIAVVDSTMIYVSPTCPTSVPVPDSVLLMRGQVYRITSAEALYQDLTGTTIRSSFPIVVLNGHEGAQLPDLTPIKEYRDKLDDVENLLMEQARPIEYWTTDNYTAVPFDTNVVRSAVHVNFPGCMFRTEPAYDAGAFGSAASVDLLSTRGSMSQRLASGIFQQFDSVQPAIVAKCDSTIPIDCIQYDYYRGSLSDLGVTHGFSAPMMMNIVPVQWWKTEYLWHVPASSVFHSGQYIGVIYYDQSPPTIVHRSSSQAPTPVPLPVSHVYTYPGNPQLRCASVKVAPGTYWATGTQPFIIYSYGRSENNYKVTSAYGAPCGMMGIDWSVSHSSFEFDSSCTGWTGTLTRSGNPALLIRNLNVYDPVTAAKLHVKPTTNMTLAATQVDDTTWTCVVRPIDPMKNGALYLYTQTISGLQFVRLFSYVAPKYSLPKLVTVYRVLIGRDTCIHISFVNKSPHDTYLVDSITLTHVAPEFTITGTSRRLPAEVPPSDSLGIDICCRGGVQDTLYADTAALRVACLSIPIPLNLTVIAPRVNWLSPNQADSLVCGARDTVRVWLINDNLTGGQEVMKDVHIVGPDAGEFSIVGNQLGYSPLQDFPMDPGQKIWIDVAFTPDMTKPAPQKWADRHATIVAANNLRNDPKIELTAVILQPQLSCATEDIDLGSTIVGKQLTTSVGVSNTGNAPLTIASIAVSDPRLTTTGLAVGDRMLPGDYRAIDLAMSSSVPDTIIASVIVTTVEDCAGADTLIVRMIATDDPKLRTSATLSTAQYPPQFTCERSEATVTFENTGETDVELVAADILNDATGAFTFSDGSQHLAILQHVGSKLSTSIAVSARPVQQGTSTAMLVLTWDSLGTVVSMETPLSVSATLATSSLRLHSSAISPTPGALFHVTIDLPRSPRVTPTDLTFTLRYRGDLFSYRSMTSNYGVAIVSSDYAPDGYQIMTLTTRDASAFKDGTELCDLTFEVMLSLEDSTTIELQDPKFVHGEDSLCVETTLSPAFLSRGDLCGDSLMKQVLLGVTELSIDGITPSPATGAATIHLHSARRGDATISVIDGLGRTLLRIPSEVRTGSNAIAIDLNALPSGVYGVRIEANGAAVVKMFMHER